jgi:hypothetical protein
MLADSRDVLFHRDPFAGLPLGITTGLESILARVQPANLQWLQRLHGGDSAFPLADIFSQSVICSGVTLGDTATIKTYLKLICAELMQKLPRMIHTPYLDQSTHNGLIRIGRMHGVHLTSIGEDSLTGLLSLQSLSSQLEQAYLKRLRSKVRVQ